MKIKRDQITGLVLIIIGIVFGILTSQFKKPMTAAYPGPKLMPVIAVVGLIICGAGVLVSGCKQKTEDKPFLVKAGYLRIIVTFAVLCGYILLMKFFGFLIVTPFVLYGITTYFAAASKIQTRLWVRIVFSVAVTIALYLMYVVLFEMTLPVGELFDLGKLIFG